MPSQPDTRKAPAKRICVFSGSKPGFRRAYTEATSLLGREIAVRGFGLVYGGATPGLMGTIADTVLNAGGEVVGVIPDRMVTREIAHEGLTELHVVSSMHDRKALMMDLADAFVALPGGYGTLDELSEVLTWSQLRLHAKPKPCGLLNVEGFFDSLIAYLDNIVREGFLKPFHRSLILDDTDAGRLLDQFERTEADPLVEKW